MLNCSHSKRMARPHVLLSSVACNDFATTIRIIYTLLVANTDSCFDTEHEQMENGFNGYTSKLCLYASTAVTQCSARSKLFFGIAEITNRAHYIDI